MEKKRLTRILSRATAQEVRSMSDEISKEYEVTIIKEPAKTLVMLPMREPTNGTVFYIGELLAVDAMVELAGRRGTSVCMGDDFDKALGMAVIDAAFNAAVPCAQRICERLLSLETAQQAKIEKEAALHEATKVSFKTMEGQ